MAKILKRKFFFLCKCTSGQKLKRLIYWFVLDLKFISGTVGARNNCESKASPSQHTHIHILILYVHVFGWWEENKEPRGNSYKHCGTCETPHRP